MVNLVPPYKWVWFRPYKFFLGKKKSLLGKKSRFSDYRDFTRANSGSPYKCVRFRPYKFSRVNSFFFTRATFFFPSFWGVFSFLYGSTPVNTWNSTCVARARARSVCRSYTGEGGCCALLMTLGGDAAWLR